MVLLLAASGVLGGLIGLTDSLGDRYRWIIALAPISALALVLLYGSIMKHWKWGIYGLVAYMPFSGLPGILLYSYIGSGWASLIKDLFFVIPAYLGYVWWQRNNKGQARLQFPGATVTVALMLVLAGLVFVHLFNPQLVNPLVGLIGLKVWLFYLPLYVLGYHLISSKKELVRLAQITLALGMIPVLYGIAQAGLIYRGYTGLAYALHGPAAEAATQLFARFDAAGGTGLVRVPGLFTFPLQYSSLLLVLLAIGYALWSGGDAERSHGAWYAIASGAVVVALVTSGARAIYVLLPAYYVLALLLNRRSAGIWKPAFALAGLVPAGVGVLVWLLGSTPRDFLAFAADIVKLYLGTGSQGSLINQFGYALRLTWLGMGTGMNTNQARYALGPDASSSYVNLVLNAGVESFQGKAILELGVPGLVVTVALFGWLLVSGYRRLRQLQDHSLRSFGVGLLSLLAITVAYLYKGAILDYDPLNVYFWLFAGILMKLPELQTVSSTSLPRLKPDE
jgi:hypothetical protein